jgi:hypothetical protein
VLNLGAARDMSEERVASRLPDGAGAVDCGDGTAPRVSPARKPPQHPLATDANGRSTRPDAGGMLIRPVNVVSIRILGGS